MAQESEPQVNKQNKPLQMREQSNEPKSQAARTRFLPVLNASAPALDISAPKPTLVRNRREERCDAVQNRERVLEAANTLFAQRGVAAVTMSEIAETAKVGKGTLYRRFAHKGQLCQALMDANTRDFQNEVLSGFGDAGRTATTVERLWLFIDRLLKFTEENAELLEAAFEAHIEQGGTVFYSQPAYDWLRMTMHSLLQEVSVAGETRQNLDLDFLADALLAPLQVGLYLHQRQVRGFSMQRIRNGFEQLLNGVLITTSTHKINALGLDKPTKFTVK